MLQRLDRKNGVPGDIPRHRLAHQRPAPRVGHTADKGASAGSPRRARTLAGRRQQRTQAGEAVGVHQPHRHQLAQGVLQFAAQQMGIVLQFVEEQRAMGLQAIEHALRPR